MAAELAQEPQQAGAARDQDCEAYGLDRLGRPDIAPSRIRSEIRGFTDYTPRFGGFDSKIAALPGKGSATLWLALVRNSEEDSGEFTEVYEFATDGVFQESTGKGAGAPPNRPGHGEAVGQEAAAEIVPGIARRPEGPGGGLPHALPGAAPGHRRGG